MSKKANLENSAKTSNGKNVCVSSDESERNIVKSHRLNTAIHNLSLPEMRLIQLAIVSARKSGQGLHPGKPLRIHASQYAEVFGVGVDAAYKAITAAEKTLFDRSFTFQDRSDGNLVKSRWLQQVKYLSNNGAIELTFSNMVVSEISGIDGAKKFFTQYALKQTAPLRSLYSLRLYELVVQWLASGVTPMFEIQLFRQQLEVEDGLYTVMSNFKRRVLDSSIKEINEATDLFINYEQIKAGRTIVGFKFYVNKKPKEVIEAIKAGVEVVDIEMRDALSGGVVLSERQALKFSRLLANNVDFLPHVPKHYETKEQILKYLQAALRTPNFVETYKSYLKDVGFNLASGVRVESVLSEALHVAGSE